MINANEVRLGNIIFRNGTEQIVSEIWKYGFSCEPINTDLYNEFDEKTEGVPLTEERLLKAGFKIDGTVLTINQSHNGSFILENWGNNLTDEIELYYTAGYGIKLSIEIKYIHQLQNLYFALTGKELEFNE